jgi:hypothetical protein
VVGQEPKSASTTKRDADPKPGTAFLTEHLPLLVGLGDTERLRASKVGEYTLRKTRSPRVLQNVLFAYP